MTILIVDDSEENLRALRLLLDRHGYQVVTAAEGAEALAKARQNPPDLVVSDIFMPVAMPAAEEVVYLKHYNEVLIRKLEHKMEQLERVNCELEQDIAGRKQAEALRFQAERLQILHEMDQGILAAQSPEAVAQAALDKLVRLVPCQRASVCLFDLESREAAVLAAWSVAETGFGAGRRFPLEEFAEELRLGGRVSVADLAAAALKGSVYQALQAEGVRALVNFPLVVGEEVIGSLNLGANVPGAFVPPHLEIVAQVADLLTLGLENARLLQQARQHHSELKALTARLVETGESERRRLASELHDRIGQKLTLLSIGLDFVRSQVPPEAAAATQARLDDCQRLVAETAERTRDVMAELRPPVLDDYGVLAALRWFGGQFARRTGLKVIVLGQEPVPRLPSAKETALFRIAQEALNNTAKHAQACQVTVDLQVSASHVWLTVADDGAGFQPRSRPAMGAAPHWGLLTMREQAEAGGWESRGGIRSRPGHAHPGGSGALNLWPSVSC